MSSATATARLEARISTDLHAMLKRAAELQGRTLTDFVVAAVHQRAIEQAEVIRLSLADQECFAQALFSPPTGDTGLATSLRPSQQAPACRVSRAPFLVAPLMQGMTARGCKLLHNK
jgi:uncharacterized protein (DUF1778 family)